MFTVTSSKKPIFVFSGNSPDGNLVEVIELPNHPFFIASQFHPEFRKQTAPTAPLVQGLHRRRPRAYSPAAA